MKNSFDILIIGGGASGIVAAISAKEFFPAAKVAIAERLNRVGKKILATGNGRCNLSNSFIELNRYHGENVKFVMSAFSSVSVKKTLSFFASLGVLTREEADGKIFPCSGQASAVLDLLRHRLLKLGISELTDFEAVDVIPENDRFVVSFKSGDTITAKSVIVSVGGAAGPQFGTDGSGLKLLEKLGHTKNMIYPALTKLKSTSPLVKSLQGIKIDGRATLKVENNIKRVEDGEILFTDYGLSGPPILQLSGEAINALNHNQKPKIFLDLIPEKSLDEVKTIINFLIKKNPEMPLDIFFAGLLNKQIGKALVKTCELGKLSDAAGTLPDRKISQVANLIKSWKFEISGYKGWRDAQTTAGGIKVSEFYPSSMESRKISGLFVTGEALDIYGDCGGFNLQWAWSSGYLAGMSAAERLKNE